MPSILRLTLFILGTAGGELPAAEVAHRSGSSVRTILCAVKAFPGHVSIRHASGLPAILTAAKIAGVPGGESCVFCGGVQQKTPRSGGNPGKNCRGSEPVQIHDPGAAAEVAAAGGVEQNLQTVCLYLTNKQGGAGGKGLTAADLEASLPKLVEMTGMPRAEMAERIACAITFGKNPAGYLKRLLETGAVLAEYQRAKVRPIVARMLGALNAGPVPDDLPVLEACPDCGGKVVARGRTRAQCWECHQMFEGTVSDGKESIRRGKERQTAKAEKAARN